jgi:hypothetical protein
MFQLDPIDHKAAAALIDKDAFLNKLTVLNDKISLFKQTFYSKQPRKVGYSV